MVVLIFRMFRRLYPLHTLEYVITSTADLTIKFTTQYRVLLFCRSLRSHFFTIYLEFCVQNMITKGQQDTSIALL